ncbi:MAG: DUF1015 family protein [Ignavibacteriaceae bacterium]|jgi:uncharacterized protein (DUF1015 family)|nr:DUF1015 family protein [Ignavibacteriaceae bacterium]
MAVIRPFKAMRPIPEMVTRVASVPYDVVNTDEARTLAKDNPLSLLNCTRSEIHFPDSFDHYAKEVYQKAKEVLEEIKRSAPLVIDEKPNFYLYKLVMNGRAQTGIAATFSVNDYDNDVIKKHEKTRKEKEDDRTNHIVTTEAQTGPVFLTYKGVAAIDQVVEKVTSEEKPLYNFTAADGIQHTVWKLPAEYNQLFVDEMAKVKNFYIADGHHRAASASRARKVKMEKNTEHTGAEEYNFFIAVLFPAEQLHILPYYRVVMDLNGNSKEEFLNTVAEKFSIEKTLLKEPREAKSFCMFLGGDWYLLKALDAVLASNSLSSSVGDHLDVSILQNFLLQPVLGIDDPRTNKRIDFVGGIRGTGELEKLVNSGKFAVAFSLFPVTVNDLMNISDANEVMPPKSTWFEPKLRDGLLIHTI